MPARMKNFFDWQTLPVPALKPLGIVGASNGVIGTNRAQMDLRKIAHYSDVEVMGDVCAQCKGEVHQGG